MANEIITVATIEASEDCYELEVLYWPEKPGWHRGIVRLRDDVSGTSLDVSVSDVQKLVAALTRAQEIAEERRNATP